MMSFNCPHCRQVIKCPEQLAGSTASCPHCQAACIIPAPGGAAARRADRPAPPAASQTRDVARRAAQKPDRIPPESAPVAPRPTPAAQDQPAPAATADDLEIELLPEATPYKPAKPAAAPVPPADQTESDVMALGILPKMAPRDTTRRTSPAPEPLPDTTAANALDLSLLSEVIANDAAQAPAQVPPPPKPAAPPPRSAAAKSRSSSGVPFDQFVGDCFRSIVFMMKNFGTIVGLVLFLSVVVGVLWGLLVLTITLMGNDSRRDLALYLRTDTGFALLILAIISIPLAIYGYLFRYYSNVVQCSIYRLDDSPQIPGFNFGHMLLSGLRLLGLLAVYVCPIITLPLLPIGMMGVGYSEDIRGFNLRWAFRVAARRPGQLAMTWLAILAYAVATAIIIAVVRIIFWRILYDLDASGGRLVANLVAFVASILVLSMTICANAIHFRCAGVLGHYNREILDELDHSSPLPALGWLVGGAAASVVAVIVAVRALGTMLFLLLALMSPPSVASHNTRFVPPPTVLADNPRAATPQVQLATSYVPMISAEGKAGRNGSHNYMTLSLAGRYDGKDQICVDSKSPLATYSRGEFIVERHPTGVILRNPSDGHYVFLQSVNESDINTAIERWERMQAIAKATKSYVAKKPDRYPATLRDLLTASGQSLPWLSSADDYHYNTEARPYRAGMLVYEKRSCPGFNGVIALWTPDEVSFVETSELADALNRGLEAQPDYTLWLMPKPHMSTLSAKNIEDVNTRTMDLLDTPTNPECDRFHEAYLRMVSIQQALAKSLPARWRQARSLPEMLRAAGTDISRLRPGTSPGDYCCLSGPADGKSAICLYDRNGFFGGQIALILDQQHGIVPVLRWHLWERVQEEQKNTTAVAIVPPATASADLSQRRGDLTIRRAGGHVSITSTAMGVIDCDDVQDWQIDEVQGALDRVTWARTAWTAWHKTHEAMPHDANDLFRDTLLAGRRYGAPLLIIENFGITTAASGTPRARDIVLYTSVLDNRFSVALDAGGEISAIRMTDLTARLTAEDRMRKGLPPVEPSPTPTPAPTPVAAISPPNATLVPQPDKLQPDKLQPGATATPTPAPAKTPRPAPQPTAAPEPVERRGFKVLVAGNSMTISHELLGGSSVKCGMVDDRQLDEFMTGLRQMQEIKDAVATFIGMNKPWPVTLEPLLRAAIPDPSTVEVAIPLAKYGMVPRVNPTIRADHIFIYDARGYLDGRMVGLDGNGIVVLPIADFKDRLTTELGVRFRSKATSASAPSSAPAKPK